MTRYCTCENEVKVVIHRLDKGKDLPLPFYATSQAAGMDLFACVSQSLNLRPLERILVSTGFRLALPKRYEAQIRPRSGLALKKGVTVINAPGTIDSDYRGEIFVPLINLSSDIFVIERGLRMAQMVVAPVSHVLFEEVPFLEEETSRGDKGFGSTGY